MGTISQAAGLPAGGTRGQGSGVTGHRSGLVLTRRIDQEIVIPLKDGEEIVIKPIGHRANGVQLHISAPSWVTIHRREILDQIRAQDAAGQLGITIPQEAAP